MPLILLLGAMVVIVAAEQMVCDKGVAETTGDGFTCTVAVTGEPAQPPTVGVMVKGTVTAAAVVFVKAPLMLPDPLEAIPVTKDVLFLVQL